MKIDLEKANAAIDEYLRVLTDPHSIGPQISGRTWIMACLERNGVIESVRKVHVLEHHAVCYACLILTKRVREVSRAEKQIMPVQSKRGTTERTIRSLRNGKLRDTVCAPRLEAILTENRQRRDWRGHLARGRQRAARGQSATRSEPQGLRPCDFQLHLDSQVQG
jgi:hypothetical protein